MSAAFQQPLDIANRACQHLGVPQITSLSQNIKPAVELSTAYDKLRVAELRRSVWRFATRRAILRPLTSTTLRMVPATWAVGTTYAAGNIVADGSGVLWISLQGSNTGNVPGAFLIGSPFWTQYFGPIYGDLWAARTGTDTYSAGEIVYKSGPVFYICTANNVTAADPASGAPWVAVGSGTTSISPTLIEPAGPSMSVNTIARNIFPLPNGYLRAAGQDPRIASTSRLETSAALKYNDWQFEGNAIISSSTTPILLRFVADVADVPAMDPMFAEGLAARLAVELCQAITQSAVKQKTVDETYERVMTEARLVNWIETGSTEPQERTYEIARGPQQMPTTNQQPQQGETV